MERGTTTEYSCSSKQKQINSHHHLSSSSSSCAKLYLPGFKLVILLVVLMSVPTSSKSCSTSPNSCIGGRCRTYLMINMRINICKCDVKCTGNEPQVKLCDRKHKKDFNSWCELRKQRCLDQIDYKPTIGRCAAIQDEGIDDLVDMCFSHYCGYGGYAVPDKNDGRCFCRCHPDFTGGRCETKILSAKKRILRKIMKRSVD